MLGPAGARLVTRLVPRVGAAWPAIGAIALAVVLAHSGYAHLGEPAAVTAHYRATTGSGEWTRIVGIAQMLAAGGLLFRRTRLATACVLGAVLVAAILRQWLSARAGEAVVTAAVLGWVVLIAVGEARRAGPRAGR